MIKKQIWLLTGLLIVIGSALTLYWNYNPKRSTMPNYDYQTQSQAYTENKNANLDEQDQAEPAIVIDANLSNINHETPSQTSQNCDHKYHIVFDVGQVLLDNSNTGAAKAVGMSNMFWYTVKHKKTPESKDIQARLFDFIDYCTKLPRGHALFNGQPLPGIMCEWAKGKINTSEILKIVTHYEAQAKEFFKSEEEKNLVFGALNLFKPDVICNIQKPITKMVELFEDCCKNFPNQVYILSNWDQSSALLIRKKFPQIFTKIPADHILFSGDIGEVKPQASAFNYLTDRFKTCNDTFILIDDNPENVKMARSLGWKAILHKHPERTARKLKRLTK